MNILHIMEDYKPTIGGSVVRNSNMIDSYHREFPEDKIYLVNLEGNLYKQKSNEDGIYVYRAKNLKEQIYIAHKLIKKAEIDVIHTHNFRFLFVGFLAKGLKKIKIVNEIHALYRMSFFKEVISYCLLQKVNNIIVLAESAKDYLVKNNNLQKDKITVIRNGIEKPNNDIIVKGELYKKIQEMRKKDYIIISYNGSFIEWQGVRILADQMEKLLELSDKLFLLMLGDGNEYKYVEDKARKCKYRDRIFIHSGITKKEMLSLYEQIDIILIPRIKNLATDTAVPLKAIEAMQFCKCILASGDNGIKEVLNSDNAMIYEAGNYNDLRKKLKILIFDKELREHLGKRAKKNADKLLVSWEENSRRVNMLYNSK